MVKASIPWNAKQIHKMVTNNCLTFDNAIQRGFVWDKKRSSMLIDTMLREYPVPPIYTIKTDNKVQTQRGDVSVYDVLDGKQRSLTVAKFKDNGFALTNIDTFIDENGKEIDLNGCKYDDLPEEFKDKFDSYAFTVIFFSDATEDEVVEIMARLNNGKAMSNIENTRINAKDLIGIQNLANHEFLIDNLTTSAINGYNHEDIVVKMAMILSADTDAVCLDNKEVRPIYQTLMLSTDTELSKRINNILTAMGSYYSFMIAYGKKQNAKRFLKKTNLLSTVKVIEQGITDKKSQSEMVEFLTQFFDGNPSSSNAYNTACQNGTNHAPNVEARFKAINKAYKTFFK